MMAWEWCGLDESDIQHAIELQLEEGEIDSQEIGRLLAYLRLY
jgi:hypothetical protein